jgi:hypothetical protein
MKETEFLRKYNIVLPHFGTSIDELIYLLATDTINPQLVKESIDSCLDAPINTAITHDQETWDGIVLLVSYVLKYLVQAHEMIGESVATTCRSRVLTAKLEEILAQQSH